MDEKAPLRLQFKRFLNKERLDERQYVSLRKKLETSGVDWANERNTSYGTDLTDVSDTFSREGRRRAFWVAAAAILVVITALSVIRITSMTDDESSVLQRIAEEVATNHIKIQHPDFETSSMEEIRVFLDRLDFVPTRSDLIDQSNYLLIGARYCTLQGKIAAHLMFDSPKGETISHYQAAYDPVRFGMLPDIANDEVPRSFIRRGVEVQIWVEQDLLMARAHTVQNNHKTTYLDRKLTLPE